MVTVDSPSAGAVGPSVDELEPNDDVAHAQELKFDLVLRGSISGAGDNDLFWFQSPARSLDSADGGIDFDEVRIELRALSGLHLALDLLDAEQQTLLAHRSDSIVVPNFGITPGRRYFVRLAAADKLVDDNRYTLVAHVARARAGSEVEPNDERSRETPVLGLSSSGYFGWPSDTDWLRLPLNRGTDRVLQFELTGVSGVACELSIVGDSGLPIAATRGKPGAELRLRNIGLPDKLTDAHVMLHARSGANVEERWVLRASVEPWLEGTEREPNDSATTANLINAASPTVSGFLWPGDVDVFRLQGFGDGLIGARLEGISGIGLRLERLDETGKGMQRVEGGAGKDVELAPLPAKAGTLFRISARPQDTVFETPYRLNITTK